MTTVRQYLIFLTGHQISAKTPAEEVGSLSKIGAAIAFASFLASLQDGDAKRTPLAVSLVLDRSGSMGVCSHNLRT